MLLATQEAPAFDLNIKSYLSPLILECVLFSESCAKKRSNNSHPVNSTHQKIMIIQRDDLP